MKWFFLKIGILISILSLAEASDLPQCRYYLDRLFQDEGRYRGNYFLTSEVKEALTGSNRTLDFGAGTGRGTLALLNQMPARSTLYHMDSNSKALEIAKKRWSLFLNRSSIPLDAEDIQGFLMALESVDIFYWDLIDPKDLTVHEKERLADKMSSKPLRAVSLGLHTWGMDREPVFRRALEKLDLNFIHNKFVEFYEPQQQLNLIPDEFFDVVVASDVLLHVPHEKIDSVLNELKRITKRVLYFTSYVPHNPSLEPGKTFGEMSLSEVYYRDFRNFSNMDIADISVPTDYYKTIDVSRIWKVVQSRDDWSEEQKRNIAHDKFVFDGQVYLHADLDIQKSLGAGATVTHLWGDGMFTARKSHWVYKKPSL